jgi:hypothetical protein
MQALSNTRRNLMATWLVRDARVGNERRGYDCRPGWPAREGLIIAEDNRNGLASFRRAGHFRVCGCSLNLRRSLRLCFCAVIEKALERSEKQNLMPFYPEHYIAVLAALAWAGAPLCRALHQLFRDYMDITRIRLDDAGEDDGHASYRYWS